MVILSVLTIEYQPSISQQVSSSGYIAIWFYIPPLRYAYGSIDTEGIYYADFNKGSLSFSEGGLYAGSESDIYKIKRAPFRKYEDRYNFDNEQGNYQGWQYGSKVHLDFLVTESDSSRSTKNWHQYNSSWSVRS